MQHCMQCSRWECCPSEHRDDRRGRSECSRFHFDQMRRDVFHSLYICLGCGAGGKRSQTEEIVPVYLGTFLLPDQAVLKSLPIRRAPSAPFLYPPDGPHGGGGHARSMEALLHKPRCVEWRPCPRPGLPKAARELHGHPRGLVPTLRQQKRVDRNAESLFAVNRRRGGHSSQDREPTARRQMLRGGPALSFRRTPAGRTAGRTPGAAWRRGGVGVSEGCAAAPEPIAPPLLLS